MTNVYQLVSLIKLKCVHRTLRNPLQLEMCPQNPSKPWHFLRKPVQALKELLKGSNYYLKAEIVEMTLVISWFRFLRVESRISELCVIILPETQILKVGSRISDLSCFCFSFLNFYVAPSHFKRLGT